MQIMNIIMAKTSSLFGIKIATSKVSGLVPHTQADYLTHIHTSGLCIKSARGRFYRDFKGYPHLKNLVGSAAKIDIISN